MSYLSSNNSLPTGNCPLPAGKVRVRFAPSPTGPLHIGGVRTALFNYLFARQHGGDFILRIEDTDAERFVPGAEAYIIEALQWCGIAPNEGLAAGGKIAETADAQNPHAPYRQSQRKPLYRQYAEQLIANGYAYYAFDTADELAQLRKTAEAGGQQFIYNYSVRNHLQTSLNMPDDAVQQRLLSDNHWVIRFKMPENREVHMLDLIRGEVTVNTQTLDDKVLWKRIDELPTYHLANIVDDHLMEISHVIRGEEWLPSLPLHYLLYEAFGWSDSQPAFAHLPLLLKPDGKGKLSKRDGDRLGFPVFPLRWVAPDGEISRGYREDGYFSQAFVNMLALLGWNPGTEQEIFTIEELIKCFRLERVIKSGARFNPEKAKWFNQQYLKTMPDTALAQSYQTILKAKGITASNAYVAAVCGLVKERATFVEDFWDLSSYFFVAPENFDEKVVQKYWKPETPDIIRQVAGLIDKTSPFTKEKLETAVHEWILSNNLGLGAVMNALRLCIVGASKGPRLFDIIALLGKEKFNERINTALGLLKSVK
ncbi:MAG: glutamate--tRNA ligase [Prevotellaceae bacterium]|jgi:glutamyl-tRNA synthetase|nr:glutamate--tRNA ligase [Prevotellaceae bacterium]